MGEPEVDAGGAFPDAEVVGEAVEEVEAVERAGRPQDAVAQLVGPQGRCGGEGDAAFGRVHPPLPAGLAHRLVRLEPVDAVLSADHPLATAPALRPDQLRDSVLWSPGALDRLDFLHRFADHFGIRERAAGVNLGLAHFLTEVAQDPRRFSLVPADVPLPEIPGLRTVPLIDPTPLYAWSLLWNSANGHPDLTALTAACAAEAGAGRWLEYDPARDWLPLPPDDAPGPAPAPGPGATRW
ncbi:LysR substrate-binding domain-containing protein [Streptomyces sp. 12297]